MNPKEILYPQSRFEVLRALYKSPTPVSLREISYRAEIVLTNVQRAVEFLLSKKIVAQEQVGQRIYYRISSPDIKNFVSTILNALEPFEIKARADSLKNKSLELIDTIQERSGIIEHAKKSLKI